MHPLVRRVQDAFSKRCLASRPNDQCALDRVVVRAAVSNAQYGVIATDALADQIMDTVDRKSMSAFVTSDNILAASR